MALDSGKKVVRLKPIDTAVPHVKSESTFSIAVDSFKPTLDRLEIEADATAKAKYFNNFDIKTRDQFIKFQEEFKFDPSGMKAAVDTYAGTLLEKVPPAYKIQAQAKLAGWSTNSVISATSNKIQKDNNDLISDWGITWDKQNGDIEFKIKKASDISLTGLPKSLELSLATINEESKNGMLLIGDKAQTELELLVNTKGLLTGEDHDKNLINNIKGLLVSRGYHIMRALENGSGDDQVAKAWLYDYSQAKDKYGITIDEKFKENPVYKITNRLMKDDDTRLEIINSIQKLYKEFHAKTILDLKESYQSVNITGEQEVGGALHINEFVGIDNAQLYMQENFPNIKPSDRDKILPIVNYNMRMQSIVTKAIDNKTAPAWTGSASDIAKDKRAFTNAVLSRYGINNIENADVDNSKLKDAIDILNQHGEFPHMLTEYVNNEIIGDMSTPMNLNNFKNQIKLAEFLESTIPGFTPNNKKLIAAMRNDWDRNDEYLISAANDWKPKNDNEIIHVQNEIFSKENKEFFEEKLFDWMNKRDVTSDAWWFGKFFNEQNKWTKHVTDETTTFFPWDAESILTGPVKHKLLEYMGVELARLLPDGADPTNEAYSKYIDGAIISAMNRLKEENYYPTKYSGAADVILQKDSFEKHYPGINGDQLNNEVMAYVFSKYDFKTPSELSAFNKKLEEVFNKGYLAEQKSKLTSWKGLTSSKEERAAAKIEMEKWYKIYDEMVATNEEAIGSEWGEHNPLDVLKVIADNGGKGYIIEPKGHLDGTGKPAYHLALQLPNGERIDITGANETFSPSNYSSLASNSLNLPKSHAQFKNNLVNQEYEEFMKEYGHIIGDSDFAKRAMHGIIDVAMGMGNWRYYPDVPGIDDVPAEVRPFAFIMKALGVDVDFREMNIKMKKAIKNRNEVIAFDKQISANMDLSNHEKTVEALVPFWEMPYSKANLDLTYKTYAKENYNNTTQNLGLRTNNYLGVHWINEGKTGELWDGQLNYKVDGNHQAVFSSPEHSVRAAIKIIINHSELISNNIKKDYGSTPTVKEIFTMYSKNPTPYFEAFKKFGYNENDRINFLNANEVHRLIKMMMNVEMGTQVFEQYFPSGKHLMLDAIIFKGYNSAINSYNGKLGKI
jgi:hypothetical protein|tara:strand:- start:5382 stop:8756 length:3375 start_codon:yes stop_codon:yes gene_type:complete